MTSQLWHRSDQTKKPERSIRLTKTRIIIFPANVDTLAERFAFAGQRNDDEQAVSHFAGNVRATRRHEKFEHVVVVSAPKDDVNPHGIHSSRVSLKFVHSRSHSSRWLYGLLAGHKHDYELVCTA